MNKRYTIIGILVFLLIAGSIVCTVILSKDRTFDNIDYQIDFSSDSLFEIDDLKAFVKKNCSKIIGQPIDSVNRVLLERQIANFPYIQDVNVISSRSSLIIKAKQEKAMVKVYNKKDEVFYIAQNGRLLPESKRFKGRILIANGDFENGYQSGCYVCTDSMYVGKEKPVKMNLFPLYSIWRLGQMIEKDCFWKAQISQIYYNSKKEIELVPTVGTHIILFGKISLGPQTEQVITNRLENLKSLYINGFSVTGWNKYREVNLKYGREIPCQKR